MKILHCCLASIYVDDFNYQENILPEKHLDQGHNVQILASTETYVSNTLLGYIAPKSYYTARGIRIDRIPYINTIPHKLARKLRIYSGISKILEEFHPDIIFLHDVQFISVTAIVKYARKHSVKIYADCHTDYMNSAKNWISKNILHRIIYKWCTKKIEPYVIKFWGVTPSRRDFLNDFYGVPKDKTDLLVMGVDHKKIPFLNRNEIREVKRKELGILQDDFVIITGGKIVPRKNIHILMEAFNSISDKRIKLVIFGSVSEEIKVDFHRHLNNKNIIYLGWQNFDEINNLCFASDLAVFPGTHSVIWEQVVGLGLPAIFKFWKGYEHLDLGGNCKFLKIVNVDTLIQVINDITVSKESIQAMKELAESKGIEEFDYDKIAKKAIEMVN